MNVAINDQGEYELDMKERSLLFSSRDPSFHRFFTIPKLLSSGQLMVEEEKKEDDYLSKFGPSSIVSSICYTGPPKNPERRAGVFLDKPGACPLRPGTVAAQHGSLPLQEKDKDLLESCDELHPRNVRIWNGRSCDAFDTPRLGTLGFELIQVPKSRVLSTNEGLQNIIENHPELSQKHYSELAPFIRKVSGAKEAIAYCHVARGSTNRHAKFAGYAHTDLSHESWANLLPQLVESGEWDGVGPTGIPLHVAQRAASSKRYAVLSAWRYLGPSDKCRSSHLAVLDHRSVRKQSDLLPLSLVANGCHGGNYRLSSASSSQHEWYYYPEMTPEEVLLFTCFDSNHPAKDTTFANTPITTCMHSAFRDPNPPKDEPSRQSIDIRFLLIWD